MIGGLSHFEVCSLQDLERSRGTQRLVIGSTAIVTAQDFIESVCPQQQAKPKKEKRKRQLVESEEEEEEQPSFRSGRSKQSRKPVDDAIELEDIEVKKKGDKKSRP